LTPRADDPTGDWRPAVHEQPHRDCGRVPSARREAAEQRRLGSLVVEVERLRVELCRERLDLGLLKQV
jgi:hypothetical protein